MLIEDGVAMGLSASDLLSLFNARIFYRPSREPKSRLAMVGIYQAATARYARLIASHLGSSVTVDAVTLEALERDPTLRKQVGSANLVVTFANRHREVEALLPDTAVATISFIPSEETRLALASLNPLVKVGLVSRVPEFLPIMIAGVQRFAPHVERTSAAVLDGGEPAGAIAASDVIVYATGAEAILDQLKSGIPAIEYRHIPDPADIERVIVPLIRRPPPRRADARKGSIVKIGEMNWSQVEQYLKTDDRAVLPLGSTEQHAGLSLSVIHPQRVVALEAAEPFGVPVFPVLAYGITPYFLAYPGTVSLASRPIRYRRDILDSLNAAGFRKIAIVNGHGGNHPAQAWRRGQRIIRAARPSFTIGGMHRKLRQGPGDRHVASHASWMENFPWTRLAGVVRRRGRR